MVEILRETEDAPASYPPPPGSMSAEAQALDASALWRRIENWIRYRWNERQVVWLVKGTGTFEPRLTPAVIDSVETWGMGAWETASYEPSPLGIELDGGEYFRITATVGSTDHPPADVFEALRRLAEYLADTAYAGRVATSSSRRVGDITVSSDRPAAWQAKALFYSGAADLLRAYR